MTGSGTIGLAEASGVLQSITMCFLRRSCFCLLALTAALSLRAQTTPTLSAPLPAQALAVSSGAVTIDLKNYFTLPGVTGQVVQFDTVLGKFNVELLPAAAPVSVTNFLSYVTDHTYDHTLIHRTARLGADGVSNGIVQGGGYSADLPPVATAKKTPIALEYNLANTRGTLAMARSSALNSATSEWFFNTDDNSTVLGPSNGGGYAVFGRVLGTGMTVVDQIAAVPVYNASNGDTSSPFQTIPLRDVTATQASIVTANLIIVNSVTALPVYPSAGGGSAVLNLATTNSNAAVVTAALNGSVLTLTPLAPGAATVTLTATDINGNTATGTIAVTVAGAPTAPVVTIQPVPAITMVSGTVNTVVFTVAASGTPAPTYQWQRNGVNVTGKTSPTYVLTNASDAQAGTFRCIVTNSQGSVTSNPSVLTFAAAPNPGRVINLSVLTALAANESMSMGTVLGGVGTSGNKALLARAAGPSLGQLGVTGTLPDPTMTLVNSNTGATVATNNDWGGTPTLSNAFAQVGAFAYVSGNSKDAALFQSGPTALAPSSYPAGYTVQVSDTGNGAGTVIAELYDATLNSAVTATTPRLINVSVLKQIAAGGSLTAGFVIGGATAKTVLVRAIGPGLSQFGVGGVMSDPQLALFQGSAKIAENDNWNGDSQLTQVGWSVGAFSVPDPTSKDAMVLITLQPGAINTFTAQVSGVGGVAGSVLVEVYEVP